MVSAAPAVRLLRDQERAAIAYQCVEAVAKASDAKAYKNLVLGVGVNIRRMGLSAALAVVEREDAVGRRLLEHLGRAPMHVDPSRGHIFAPWIRGLDRTEYMLVTRELLQYIVWLRRAAQSLIKEP